MINLVFFLEEPSAREMLKGLLPRLFTQEEINFQYVVFEGKQDLEKRLPKRLRAWQNPNTLFIVLRDQDNGNCITIKKNLIMKCQNSGKPNTLVRIACHELESWYLGDLLAVEKSIGPANISNQQSRSKYRSPDKLANAAEELKKISPNYQKVSGSRLIGLNIAIEGNRSTSFNIFITGVKKLITEAS